MDDSICETFRKRTGMYYYLTFIISIYYHIKLVNVAVYVIYSMKSSDPHRTNNNAAR